MDQQLDTVLDVEVSTGINAHICEVCGKNFKLKGSLKRHLHVHTGDKEHICSVCGKEFAEKYLMKRHKTIHSMDPVMHICEICGSTYSSKGALHSHKKFKHENSGYVCEVCDKVFKDSYNLKRHRGFHNKEKNVCGTCGNLFRSLNEHSKVCGKQNREPPVKCEICEKTFLAKKYLKEHMGYAHTLIGKAKCSKCNKPFKHRKTMKAHEKACLSIE